MEIINLGENNSILNQFVAELRDIHIQKDRLRFRRNIERAGEIMAYEISKRFDWHMEKVESPLGIADMRLPQQDVVVGTILRAGLPFHQGFLNYIEYIASPRIEGKTLIITDPMLATGSSMELAYEALLTKGQPKHIHVASIIASRQAVEYIKEKMPADKTTVWLAAVDEQLDDHSYIVPGLGDAGDLAFGEKE